MAETTNLYIIAGILVEAVKSEGGGFYEITIVETKQKLRYPVPVFNAVAVPVEGKTT